MCEILSEKVGKMCRNGSRKTGKMCLADCKQRKQAKTALRRHSESSFLKKILNMQCVFQNSDTEKTVHSQKCRFILPTV